MNWLLPSLVLCTAFAVLLSNAALALRLSKMPAEERRKTWGGLQGVYFYIWGLTYVLSSFGCCSSFMLYVSLDNFDGAVVCIFVGMNVCYVALNDGLHRGMKDAVLACLCANVLILMWLFVYSWVVFQAGSALILATHLCNAVAIFHAVTMELIIWQEGWLIQQGSCASSC